MPIAVLQYFSVFVVITEMIKNKYATRKHLINIDNNNNFFFRLSCLTEQKSFNGVKKPTLTWTDKANLNNQVKIINSSLKINVSYQ